jgi:hypothetical protein
MRKITLGDVLDISRYELIREEHRKKILELKASRRIFVGPRIMFAFENFDTMLYQVHEMMRAERIVKEAAILQELNVYNELVPNQGQLSATVFIATGNPKDDLLFLQNINGLPNHTFLNIYGEKIIPEFDPSQIDGARISSVQYVKFNLSKKQVSNFSKSSPVVLGFDHVNYTEQFELTPQQKEILKNDLI